MHRHLAAPLILAALSAVLDSGCKGGASPSTTDAGTPGSLGPDLSAQVLARVGDRTITLGDYVAALEHMDEFDRLRYQAPERRKELLGEMIDVMLLADEAREQGYDKDPATQQEIREIVRDAVLKKARASAPAPNDIPESEVRGYFEAHNTDFHDPERRRISAIVLASEPAANAVLDALKKGPGSWGELVRSRSIDSKAKAAVPPELAGDLGFVSPPGDPRGVNGRVPDEVRGAVFTVANVGDVLPRAVEAHRKYYVVKLAGKTEPQNRTLEDAERSIRVKLAQDKAHEKELALIEQLRKQYPVQIDEAALAQVKVDMDGGEGGD
jgi:peptidyl-prolyl cis-trans isomerase C